MTELASREGFVDVPGGRAWYRIVGDGPGVPLLLLHGGPGTGHDYLEPLQALGDERPVVFYDQLGCGKSDAPDDASLWVVQRFADEVDAVRKGLGLDRIHLLGQSWGGFLAIEYMTRKPSGIVSLTLASTAGSSKAFEVAARELLKEMPQETQDTIARLEAAGDFHSPEYEAASLQFLTTFVYRGEQPWPAALLRTMMNVQSGKTYEIMWGSSEFNVTGTLSDWDRWASLGAIDVPTLITCGRYDEATPALASRMKAAIPGARMQVFDKSAHMAHMEEADEYAAVLRQFLRESEGAA